MRRRIRNHWIVGGAVFFLVLIFPLSAFCQKADIKNVHVKGGNGVWKVSFDVENCFTEKMEEAIQSGIPAASSVVSLPGAARTRLLCSYAKDCRLRAPQKQTALLLCCRQARRG